MSYTKTLTVRIACLTISSYAVEIDPSNVMVPAELKGIKLFHEDNQFFVECNGEKKDIHSYDTSPILRNATRERLNTFLAADGYLKLKQLKKENGSVDYKLNTEHRIRGGGPITGCVAYWGTKAIAYGAIAAAATFAVNTISRKPGRTRVAGKLMQRGVTTMGGIKTCPGANIVSDVMIGYDGGKSACHGTTAVITSAGGVVATHGIIESTVMWLGAIGAGCIWLP